MAGGRQNAIFIGYRRDDTQDTAGRIYDRLVTAFGEKAVFKDVDNLPIGTDFGDYILGLLPRCRIFLALIGPNWLDAKDATGQRRLDDPGDWVRIELETAFATPGLQVVPVLVNGARMPRADELPESLRRLPRLNAAAVRRDPDFSTDMARMVEALRASVQTGVLDLASLGGERKAMPAPSAAPTPQRAANRHGLMFAGGIAAALVLVALGYGAWRMLPPPPAGEVASVSEPEGVSPPAEDGAPPTQSAEPSPQQQTPTIAPQQAPPVQTQQPQAPPPQQQALAPAALPDMVRIPGGSFEMGSPPDEPNRDSDEGPQRTVRVAAFSMSRTEVTRGQWAAFVSDTGRPDPQVSGNTYCTWRNPGFTQNDNHPVVCVNWQDAQAYVQWLSARTGQRYRLPTEAEWEYAARAGTTTAYSTGSSISSSQARFSSSSTAPVGSYPANAFGLRDMHGNVWEWVEDCYSANYDATRDCSSRVNRGGSWYNTSAVLRSASRSRSTPADRSSNLGFRVARTD